MTPRLRMALLLIIIIGVMGMSIPPMVEATERPVHATYTSPEGIQFISYSKQWTSKELEALYQELLKNTHGEEFAYLGKVILDPEEWKGKQGYFQAHVITDGTGMPHLESNRSIVLGHVERLTFEEVSAVLSHEYGHLFTYYWILKAEGKNPSDADTRWAQVRGLQKAAAQYPVAWKDAMIKNYLREWDPLEILANDYVQLFGSPTAQTLIVQGKESVVSLVENHFLPPVTTQSEVLQYWKEIVGPAISVPEPMTAPKITGIKGFRSHYQYPGYRVTFSHTGETGHTYEYVLYAYYQYNQEGLHVLMEKQVHTGKAKTFTLTPKILRQEKKGNVTTTQIEQVGLPETCYLILMAVDRDTKTVAYSKRVWVDNRTLYQPKVMADPFQSK